MEKQFRELRERLLLAGVAPRHLRRYLSELRDHLADLKAEEERAGRNRSEAEKRALLRLGGIDELANAEYPYEGRAGVGEKNPPPSPQNRAGNQVA